MQMAFQVAYVWWNGGSRIAFETHNYSFASRDMYEFSVKNVGTVSMTYYR